VVRANEDLLTRLAAATLGVTQGWLAICHLTAQETPFSSIYTHIFPSTLAGFIYQVNTVILSFLGGGGTVCWRCGEMERERFGHKSEVNFFILGTITLAHALHLIIMVYIAYSPEFHFK
jgi:hypothetical protein